MWTPGRTRGRARRRRPAPGPLVREALRSTLSFGVVGFLPSVFGKPRLSSFNALATSPAGPWTVSAVRLSYATARLVVATESTSTGGAAAVVFELFRTRYPTEQCEPTIAQQTQIW